MSSLPAAVIPTENPFFSDLRGSDLKNYIYISVYDDSTSDTYYKLQDYLHIKNENLKKKPIPVEEIKPGMFVIIKWITADGTEFYRSKVHDIHPAGVVNCFRIDDGTPCSILPELVFPITAEEMSVPAIAMKCRLEGMEIFDNLPHLFMAYRLIKMQEIDIDPFYSTTVLEVKDGIPLVKMTMNGKHLKDKVQDMLQVMCEQKIFKTSNVIQAEIVHADATGFVWFHMHSIAILQQIESLLRKFDPNAQDYYNLKKNFKDDKKSWKKPYFSIPTAVYITKSKSDGEYYRAKMTKALSKNKTEVEFIDYGNKEVVDRKSLILAINVDENLAFLPPQCVKAKLHGINHLDINKLWSFVNGDVDVLVIEERSVNENTPEVEIYQLGTANSINKALKGELWHPVQPEEPVSNYPASCKFDEDDMSFGLTTPMNETPSTAEIVQLIDETEDVKKSNMKAKLPALKINEDQVPSENALSSEEEMLSGDSGKDSLDSTTTATASSSNITDSDISKYRRIISSNQERIAKIIDEFCKQIEADLQEIRAKGNWDNKILQVQTSSCSRDVTSSFYSSD